MHALAAIGSIAGTFAAGHWLIQNFGTYAVVIGTAAGLLPLALPLLRRRAADAVVAVAALALIVASHTIGTPRAPCDFESNYFCLRVVDHSGDAPFGEARGLVLDHLLHSINHAADPTMLIAPYVRGTDEIIHHHFGSHYAEGLRYFFAGGGAYTQPRAVLALSPARAVASGAQWPAGHERRRCLPRPEAGQGRRQRPRNRIRAGCGLDRPACQASRRASPT